MFLFSLFLVEMFLSLLWVWQCMLTSLKQRKTNSVEYFDIPKVSPSANKPITPPPPPMGLYLIDNINHTVLDLFETSQSVSCGSLDFEPVYPPMNCIIDYTINYAVERHLPFVLCVVVSEVSTL